MLAALITKQFQDIPLQDRSFQCIVSHFLSSPFAEAGKGSSNVTARSRAYTQRRLGAFKVGDAEAREVRAIFLRS